MPRPSRIRQHRKHGPPWDTPYGPVTLSYCNPALLAPDSALLSLRSVLAACTLPLPSAERSSSPSTLRPCFFLAASASAASCNTARQEGWRRRGSEQRHRQLLQLLHLNSFHIGGKLQQTYAGNASKARCGQGARAARQAHHVLQCLPLLPLACSSATALRASKVECWDCDRSRRGTATGGPRALPLPPLPPPPLPSASAGTGSGDLPASRGGPGTGGRPTWKGLERSAGMVGEAEGDSVSPSVW